MTKRRILICDDREDNSIEMTVSETVGDAEIVALQGEALKGALADFTVRVREFLKSDDRAEADLPTSLFDGYDLVLVDNNLAELDIPGARLTAEAILGSLRAFASSRYLVSLNKNPQVDFDLRYLVGDYATRADLALNEEHLDNTALWSAEVSEGQFAPWYWPVLFEAADRRRSQVEFVEARLDEAIVTSLEVPADIVQQLPSRAVGFLDPAATAIDGLDGTRVDQTTFWHHFRSSNRSLPLDDRIFVALGGSVDPAKSRADFLNTTGAATNPAARRIAARVVAAELDMWFRRDLLGPQELLVDAPHLQMLIGVRGQDEDDEAWNRTVRETNEPFGFNQPLFETVIAPHRFLRTEWTQRPAFWWPPIEESPSLSEFRHSGKRSSTLAFAEDTRRFVRTTGDSPAWRFVPENGSPWSPRVVERVTAQNYSPESSFAK